MESTPQPTLPMEELADLVRVIGAKDFPARLMRAARALLGADQIVVFRLIAPESAQIVLAESLLTGQPSVRALAADYIARHHGLDPNLDWLQSGAEQQTGLICKAIDADDIADSAYREALFERPGLRGKISVLAQQAPGMLYVNFYRSAMRAPFSRNDLAVLQLIAPVMLALIERHAQLHPEPRPTGVAIRRLVSLICEELKAKLSAREHLVCCLIIAGISNEGIALELGVSPHSVSTYRRRAFQKLGIATQKELYALALRLQHG